MAPQSGTAPPDAVIVGSASLMTLIIFIFSRSFLSKKSNLEIEDTYLNQLRKNTELLFNPEVYNNLIIKLILLIVLIIFILSIIAVVIFFIIIIVIYSIFH